MLGRGLDRPRPLPYKGSERHKSGFGGDGREQDMPSVALTAEATGDKRQATSRPADP